MLALAMEFPRSFGAGGTALQTTKTPARSPVPAAHYAATVRLRTHLRRVLRHEEGFLSLPETASRFYVSVRRIVNSPGPWLDGRISLPADAQRTHGGALVRRLFMGHPGAPVGLCLHRTLNAPGLFLKRPAGFGEDRSLQRRSSRSSAKLHQAKGRDSSDLRPAFLLLLFRGGD